MLRSIGLLKLKLSDVVIFFFLSVSISIVKSVEDFFGIYAQNSSICACAEIR